ncbi:MAG: hypothetical protein WEA36_03430 [Balneolaceae bacterium]
MLRPHYNRMWHIAGIFLILSLLVPALAKATSGHSPDPAHLENSSDHTAKSTHDCCPSGPEPITENENGSQHCTGMYFCTCSLQATPSSKGAVPTPDQPLTNRMVTSVDLLPTPINDTQPTVRSTLPGTPPPIWLAHQALLN